MEECKQAYKQYYEDVLMEDVVLAYVRNDEVCSDTFLKEGLLDQELGSNNWDKEIKSFIQDHMASERCDPLCTNSALAQTVDVENFLKTFAFYAVVLNIESPLTNVNNYYLAQQGGGDAKWKLLAFDFDRPDASTCSEAVCNSRLIHWSITRPTCESLEGNSLVGPLLTNSTFHSQYLGYVQEFLDTVYTSAELLSEIEEQASAIQEDVKASFGGGASFDEELSTEAATWNSGTFPLLPTMKARADDLQKQLAALDDGTYPRSTTSNAGGAAWEVCPDWQRSEPDTSECEEGCRYQGCESTGWTVEYFCHEGKGK